MSKYRVIPMQCGDNESYALLFYEADGAVMVDIHDSGTRALVQTLKTPFPVGGIATIRSIQSFDVMFFAQPDTRPCKLSRKNKEGGAEGEYEFSFEDNEFLPEPVMDWNENSEHSISVFSIGDDDAKEKDSSGNFYYPAGTLRSDKNDETKEVVVNYSHFVLDMSENEYGMPEGYVEIYGVASVEKSVLLSTGEVFSVSGLSLGILMHEDVQYMGKSLYNAQILSAKDAVGNDIAIGEQVSEGLKHYRELSLPFSKVSSVGEGVIYFYLGKVYIRVGTDEENKKASISEFSEGVSKITYTLGEYSDFYVAIRDAPVDIDVSDKSYYKRASGSGIIVGMTIDGSNTNKNVNVGQIIGLKYKSRIFSSAIWDYDSYPVGVKPMADPPVETRSKLPNKADYSGTQMRPAYGGGFGNASALYPIRGKVNLKTQGKWSGIVELQEIDMNGKISTIATISSENALSNTELSRDIFDFGSSVRVACVRREMAYEVNKSVKSDGGVVEKVLIVDDGCQWILTSEDRQVAYMRVVGKKSLSDGRNCYVCKTIGGVNKGFDTNSYALGAWCKENGYPRHIGIYQERLVYAGNKTKPTTVWMSKTNSWDDFELGTEASSAITATLSTDKYDAIRWILSNKNGITIGTDNSEFSLGSNDGAVTTADNAMATVTSNIGSSSVPAVLFGTATIMVKTGGKELYRIDYNTLSEETAGNQISLLASHLFENDPMVDMFSIKAPSNMLFCLHESGKLSSLTYEPDYGVNGWARHEILDGIDSGCVFRRGGKDVLALVVRDGDSYVLGELDLSADVWTDDGRSYESSAVTTPLVFDGNRGGYGKQTIISGCDVYIGEESKRFNVRLNGGDWVRVDRGFDEKNEPRAFEHMRVEIPANSGWVDEATVEIRSDAPYPLVVRAIGASGNG